MIENPDTQRLAELKTTFINTGHADPSVIDYYKNGGCLRQCLHEIVTLEGETELEKQADAAREDYMSAVLTRPTLRNRLARKQAVARTEPLYIDAVMAKISAVIDAADVDQALAIHQMPSLVEKSSFQANRGVHSKDLAANQLYILMDTALQEHAIRRQAIEEHQNATLRARIAGNRTLRVCIAGGLFAAAFVPELGVIPTPEEYITNDIELGLKITSGVIFGLDIPELVRLRYLQIKHDKRSEALELQLADDPVLSDLAMRIAYSSTRYGSSQGPLQVTGRYGTNSAHENKRRLSLMEKEFERLHGDPGGKPYTSSQALGYAARFLLERGDRLRSLSQPHRSVQSHRTEFMEFCRDILEEDLARMKKGLTVTRTRKELMKAIGIVPAMVMPGVFSGMSEATTLSRDTSRLMRESGHADHRDIS